MQIERRAVHHEVQGRRTAAFARRNADVASRGGNDRAVGNRQRQIQHRSAAVHHVGRERVAAKIDRGRGAGREVRVPPCIDAGIRSKREIAYSVARRFVHVRAAVGERAAVQHEVLRAEIVVAVRIELCAVLHEDRSVGCTPIAFRLGVELLRNARVGRVRSSLGYDHATCEGLPRAHQR